MSTESVNEKVQNIKSNKHEIELFIEDYKPFIAKCVCKFTGRFVQYGVDDELSIALMAFSEAINAYDRSKGHFLSFSENVIKRRLIDYYRKEKKHNKVISLNEYKNDDLDEDIDLSIKESIELFTEKEISEYRRLEIIELTKELSMWDISFSDLTKVSPKHNKTRKLYSLIIRFLLENSNLITSIKTKKQIPMIEIEKNLGIPRKKIERARKYIIAVILVYTGDYQYIKDYIDIGDDLDLKVIK